MTTDNHAPAVDPSTLSDSDLSTLFGVEGFPGYFINKSGEVFNTRFRNRNCDRPLRNPRRMTILKNSCGYLCVCLNKGGKQYKKTIHGLLMETFNGPRPPGSCVAHNNGIRTDNRMENLRWATPAENSRDMINHGNSLKGSRNKWAKLKEPYIPSILRLKHVHGMSVRKIAAIYGVNAAVIYRVITGKSWTHARIALIRAGRAGKE